MAKRLPRVRAICLTCALTLKRALKRGGMDVEALGRCIIHSCCNTWPNLWPNTCPDTWPYHMP
eukprot:8547676-Pyramimonas_sp.AAC.1